MAATISDAVTGPLAKRAYRVRLTPDGELQWLEQLGADDVVHTHEPGVGFWRKFGVSVLSWLPIEWLL